MGTLLVRSLLGSSFYLWPRFRDQGLGFRAQQPLTDPVSQTLQRPFGSAALCLKVAPNLETASFEPEKRKKQAESEGLGSCHSRMFEFDIGCRTQTFHSGSSLGGTLLYKTQL